MKGASDLLGSETNTVIGLHGLKHIVDEFFDFRGYGFDLGAFLPEHRLAVLYNFEDHEWLICGDTQDFQNALQVIIVEKHDFHGAFALGVLQMNFGAEFIT